MALQLEKTWPATDSEALTSIGYKVKTGFSAVISAASFDPKTGQCRAMGDEGEDGGIPPAKSTTGQPSVLTACICFSAEVTLFALCGNSGLHP